MKKKLKQFESIPFTHANLISLLANYKNPNDKISRLLKTRDIVKIKRGLYVLGKCYDIILSRKLLANHIYGPSYVSLDYALSYYGLIPERVDVITSITTKLTKTYNTPFGSFTYRTSPVALYKIGIVSEAKDKYSFLIATKTKALCDKIIFTKKLNIRTKKDMFSFITEDLRIEFEDIADLEISEIESCIKANRRESQLKLLCRLLNAG